MNNSPKPGANLTEEAANAIAWYESAGHRLFWTPEPGSIGIACRDGRNVRLTCDDPLIEPIRSVLRMRGRHIRPAA